MLGAVRRRWWWDGPWLPALIACALGGCAAPRTDGPTTRVARVEGPGEPRVDVVLSRGDPLAAIDALADATGRLIVVERRGRPAQGVEVALEGAPWEEALSVLAKSGRCRLERITVGGRRAVRVVQQERGRPRGGAFLRPGQLAPLRVGRGRGQVELGGAGGADDPGAEPSRGQVVVVYVGRDEVTLGVLGPAGTLEDLLLPHGARRDALLAALAVVREGDRLRLAVSRFKGRWQVESIVR